MNRLGPRSPPPVKKNASWPISPLYTIYIQKKVFDQNKKAQTHLKSFNGRQWGIFQSISGVSGASGGLRSQIFDFLTQKKSFYGNAHNSGTRRPTGLAQVSKRPLDQGLRAWPFRISVLLLVSKIACVLSSPKFWLLDQKFKMAVFARFEFLKSKNPISGHN